MARGSETIVIHPVQEKDRWGDPTGDLPEPITVQECIIWPQSTRENENAGIVVLETQSVYVPPGKPIPGASDTVTARGSEWNVLGAVGEYVNKRGIGKGSIFTIQKVGT